MCFTVYLIDKDYKLYKRILNFCLNFSYKGKIIVKVVEVCLEDWGLDGKFLTATVDNAVFNDVVCGYL